MENPVLVAEVRKEYKAIKRHQRLIATRTRLTLKQTQEVVDAYIKPLMLALTKRIPRSSSRLPSALQPGPRAGDGSTGETSDAKPPQPPRENNPKPGDEDDDGEIKPRVKTYEEMLRFIGIK